LIAVDTSALVAIAWREPGFEPMRLAMGRQRCLISPVILLEAHMVLRGRGDADADVFLNNVQRLPTVEVVPLDLPHFHAARDAFNRYGKGQGHPAQLNFGDCLSYAVAKIAGVPLLFAGEDFRLTDIEPALKP
jgi:ribonuclease VapC